MAREEEKKKKTKQDNASPNFNYPQNSSFLRKGSKVEVWSEEDGYQNAWFPATVVDPPTPAKNPPPKARTKRNKTALVRYDHMLCETTRDPLVERVKASLVRPAPPEDRQPLEPFDRYDVVDAFYNDTWWIGYVVRVVNDKYVVAFKNPPDVLELRRSDLRAHWDWVHTSNKWVRPPKEVTTGSFFTPAMEIELDLDKDKPDTTRLPAIYLGELEHGFHMVKYKSSHGEDGEGFETLKVHINQVRPRPPKIEDRDFELLEKVDAFHGSVWTVGVITKFLVGKRYTVTFSHEKREVDFDCSELRPHMDWNGERWVSGSKGHTFTGYRQEFVHACNKEKSIEIIDLDDTTCSLSESSSSSSFTPIHSAKRTLRLSHNSVDQAETSPIAEKSPYFESSNKEKVNGASNNEKSAEELPIRDNETAIEKEGQEMDNDATISAEKRETSQKSQFVTEDSLIEVANKETSERGHAREESQTLGVVEEEPKEMMVSRVENSCPPPVESDNIGMICEINKESVPPIESLQPAVEVDVANGEPVLATEDCTAEKLKKPAVACSKLTDPQSQVSSGSTQASVDDQAFSSHAEETNSLTNVNKSPGDTEATGDSALPFVKRSPIWQFVESTEVFRKLPQKPHFRPLSKCKKEEREGLAIGHMVNYANLIGKIFELQENVCQEYVDVIRGALAGYEEMGFEVEVVQDRLNEWLKTKAELERLENKLKGIERAIEELADEKARIDDEVNGVDDEIKKLAGKRSLLVEESAERRSKITKLSSEAATVDTEICSTKESIRNLVLVI